MNTKYMSMIYDSILKCEVENGRLQFTYNEKWCGGVVVGGQEGSVAEEE